MWEGRKPFPGKRYNMIVKYVADDGKEFDTKTECLEHEREMEVEKFFDQIRVFDKYGKPFSINCGVEYAYYLEVTTDEAAKALKKFYIETNECIPWNQNDTPRAGRWYYDSTRGDWCSVQDLIDEVKRIENIFNQKTKKGG